MSTVPFTHLDKLYKRSGIGREYGPDWLKEFTQEKSIFYPVGH